MNRRSFQLTRLLNKNLANTIQPVFKYFFAESYNYWRPQLFVCDAAFQDARRYYLNLSPKADFTGPFDAEGIPLTDYGRYVGIHHNPINIAQYGLGHAEYWYAKGSETSRLHFLQTADWHVRSLVDHGGYGLWLAKFDWLGIPAPWCSAMAQGQGISLLVRAYRETDRQEYLDSAVCAARAMQRSTSEGGVTRKLDQQTYFYEEIPSDPPTSILNGHFFALWGLFDLEAAGVSEFHGLWEAGVNGLKTLLPRFDVGFWSRYDLSHGWPPNLANAFYHELHMLQLEVMERLTGDPLFRAYQRRWERQAQFFGNRLLALILKVTHKVCKG